MSDILCLYATRTGNTERVMRKIGKELSAEVAKISDGKNYAGAFGFIKAIFRTYSKKDLALIPPKTEKPLNEYSRIIIGFPIWCERVSPVAKAFAEKYKEDMTGRVTLVATHMSDLPYSEQINKLYSLLGKEPDGIFSIQTESNGVSDEKLKPILEKLQ